MLAKASFVRRCALVLELTRRRELALQAWASAQKCAPPGPPSSMVVLVVLCPAATVCPLLRSAYLQLWWAHAAHESSLAVRSIATEASAMMPRR